MINVDKGPEPGQSKLFFLQERLLDSDTKVTKRLPWSSLRVKDDM